MTQEKAASIRSHNIYALYQIMYAVQTVKFSNMIMISFSIIGVDISLAKRVTAANNVPSAFVLSVFS